MPRPDMELVHNEPSPAEEAAASANLVKRIGQGDIEAETELWSRYSRGLLFLLKYRTGDPELAEDLRQETFRLALEKLRRGDIQDPAKLAAYLRGIAVKLVAGDWRKASRRRTAPDSEAVERAADQRPGPLDGVERLELQRIVRRLIDELPVARDRQILLRFYLKEESKESICASLGISDPVHFNRVLFRAKGRFKQLVLRENAKHRLRIVD